MAMTCKLAFLSAAGFVVSSLSVAAQEKGDTLKEDMTKIQGKWERTFTVDGKAVRLVKEHKGNKSTLTKYENNEVFQRHTSEFKLSKTDDARIFTFSKIEITEGKDKGKKYTEQYSFAYRIDRGKFYEFRGALIGDELFDPEMNVWTRVK